MNNKEKRPVNIAGYILIVIGLLLYIPLIKEYIFWTNNNEGQFWDSGMIGIFMYGICVMPIMLVIIIKSLKNPDKLPAWIGIIITLIRLLLWGKLLGSF